MGIGKTGKFLLLNKYKQERKTVIGTPLVYRYIMLLFWYGWMIKRGVTGAFHRGATLFPSFIEW